METHDKQGKKYALMGDLKPGSKVKTDGDFTCRKSGEVSKVLFDAGRPYIPCGAGKHFLDGQLQDTGDALMGVYPVQ